MPSLQRLGGQHRAVLLGRPVTALEARDIEIIYGDSVTERARFETLLREARGRK